MASRIWHFPTAVLSVLVASTGCSDDTARSATPEPEHGTVTGIVVNHHILVDQFGYLPDSAKVGVIRDPKEGYDKADGFSPGLAYQVRRADTGEIVLSGAPKPWDDGKVQASSGDRGWWFDFSAVKTPGRYFIFDVERNARSPAFNIDPHVYKNVLKAAMRTYYYQRSGFPKSPPHADACWTDGAAYMDKNQDREAHDVTDRENPAKVKDLSGGWFDAGDTNKYVTYAVQPVHQLLNAYAANKAAFTDDFNIPESGNGIPDLLDEVKWETDWLKKMQYADGSFALKVGAITYVTAGPPSSDKSPRFYVPSCTSATIAASGMLAHAAYAFRDFPLLSAEATDLQRRAGIAYRKFQDTPDKQTNCDSGVVKSGNADVNVQDQTNFAVEAAIYLFALTGDKTYEQFIEQHYKDMQPYHDFGWSRYKADQGEALMFYTTLAEADKYLVKAILLDKQADVKAGNQVYGFRAGDDLYRAFLHDGQYHWGSNNPRANYGTSNLDVVRHELGVGTTEPFRARAIEMLHYFHGVNPLGMVYLTNMYSYGATLSANELNSAWFLRDTKWSDAKTSPCGPAPGYVPGGPNANAGKDGVPANISPPVGQPLQKSYKDWNTAWPESSWAVTEPAIYFQSAYVELLSAFVQ